MHEHQNAPQEFLEKKRLLFTRTVDCVFEKIFSKEAPPKIPITILEAVLVGVSKNLDALIAAPPAVARSRFEQLASHQEFSELALKEGLSKKPRVIARLNTATRIFAGN
jgi:hypothetical protein